MLPALRQCLRVALVLGLVSVLAACATPSPTPTPKPTPIDTASASARIPGAVAPTSAPWRSPVPIATCPTVAEERYFDALDGELRRVGTLTIMMSEDFQRASDDPYLIEDPFWLMGMGNQFWVISRAADDILDISAPSSAAKVRRAADQMAQRLKTSMALYKIALDEKVGEPKRGRERRALDMDMLDEATTILTYAGDDGRHVRGPMASFCQIEGRN